MYLLLGSNFAARFRPSLDISKWLPAARLRPHVVLKLMLNLVKRKYPLRTVAGQRLAQQLAQQVEAKFPELEGDVPEGERQGQKPIREHLAQHAQESGATSTGARERVGGQGLSNGDAQCDWPALRTPHGP